MIGQQISHYRILEKLGSGGMGVVYKAQDTKLDRFVALKFLPLHLSQAEEEKKRFILEAKAASALDHPNICTIYEIDETEPAPGEPGGQMFIAMAYYEGESLTERIERGPMPLEEAVDIAMQVARGLERAHEETIIHRDIKPANIMITSRDEVKIVDFGLAKLAGRTMLTKEGTTLGTVAYMSPEQAQAAKVDHRTDIWALGAVLFEMIAGKQPFEGDYEQAVMYSIMNEDPEPLTGLRTGVPMELERMVCKALAKRPDERYQQVTDLLVDLKNLQKSTQTRKSTIRPQAAAKAKPRSFSVVASAMAALVVAALMFWWFRGKEPASPVAVEEQDRKIAVLPFVNITADPEQEYFCDGMTEQLITNLSRIPDLLVIARTSVMQYKKSQKDIRQISNELNVVYILEGSVRKSGNQVRVTAQLIKADEGFHLWADDYDQELTDIFAIQDDVSQSIAKALEVTFSERVSKAVATGYPRNVEAYDYHLKARHYIENIYLRTKEEKDFQQALALAQKAIELDPEYALGYSGLGYLFENHWIVTGDRRYLEKENEYAAKAYKLNPELPETNAALGLRFLREGKNDKAFSYMRSALKLSPNNGAALHLFGVFNWFLGLYQQAAEYYSKALELDPLSIHTLTNRGWTLLLIGEFDCALQVFEKAYKIQPNHVNNLNGYAFALIIKQQYRQADELLTLAESQPPGMASAELSAIRGFYYAVIGKSKQALFVNSWGGVLAILGRKDDALNFIDNASKTEGKFYYLLSYLPLVNLPIYDSLRVEPRFQEIVKREKEKYETRLRQYAIPLNEK